MTSSSEYRRILGKKVKIKPGQNSLADQMALEFLLKHHKRRIRGNNTVPSVKHIIFNTDEQKKTRSFIEGLFERAEGKIGKNTILLNAYERSETRLFLEGLRKQTTGEHDEELTDEHIPGRHPIKINDKTKTLPDLSRYILSDWEDLSQRWKAFAFHAALLSMESNVDKVYCFSLNFNYSILEAADRQPKTLDWLSRRIRYHLKNIPHYYNLEADSKDRQHAHGACLIDHRERGKLIRTFHALGKPDEEDEKNFLDLRRNFNVCYWSKYVSEEATSFQGESTLRATRKVTQVAQQVCDIMRECHIIQNIRNPKIREKWLYKIMTTQNPGAAADDDAYLRFVDEHRRRIRRRSYEKTKQRRLDRLTASKSPLTNQATPKRTEEIATTGLSEELLEACYEKRPLTDITE